MRRRSSFLKYGGINMTVKFDFNDFPGKKSFPVLVDNGGRRSPAARPSDQRFMPDIHGDCQEYRCQNQERHSFDGPQKECGIPDEIGCCHAVSFSFSLSCRNPPWKTRGGYPGSPMLVNTKTTEPGHNLVE